MSRAVHILYGGGPGRRSAGNHLGDFRKLNPRWAERDVMQALDLVLACPFSIEFRGSQHYFRRIVDGIPVEVRVMDRKRQPLRTAYPAVEDIGRIAAGQARQRVRWGPWRR